MYAHQQKVPRGHGVSFYRKCRTYFTSVGMSLWLFESSKFQQEIQVSILELFWSLFIKCVQLYVLVRHKSSWINTTFN